MTPTATRLRPELGILPPRLARLPLDPRGYPTPWFVEVIDGAPDFRVMSVERWRLAVRDRRCWTCGDPLGKHLAFVVGPMCGINRTTSEPASHLDCATWSAQHCPFLSRPHMVRRESGLPDEVGEPAGFMLRRNPGVALIWSTTSFAVFRARDVSGEAGPGYLIEMGAPTHVAWFAEGRPATRGEVVRAVESGLPALEAMCDAEPVAERARAHAELARRRAELVLLYPRA